MPIDSLVKQFQEYHPKQSTSRIREAYHFAREAHEGQLRMDGSPYISHPLAAARILSRLHVDEETLIACLLHDVPEDTVRTLEDIKEVFGEAVAFLVDGVTKLSKVKYRNNMAERQIESLKKFFLHSAKDLRIILIKLADRLHNMQTLHYVRPEKQRRIAKETMEIYVPIANLLGIWEIKSAMEDLCFRHLYPQEYSKLQTLIQKTATHREKILKGTRNKIHRELHKYGLEAEIHVRPKSLYSIFRKMVDQNQELDDLNDLIALRVIVKERADCYGVLGIIHELFRPKSGRIKDYIAIPKPNGYQSLHTTVFGMYGTPTEFQIRTREMHFEAEYGIAAHYFYKQSNRQDPSQVQTKIEKHSAWVKKVLELQKQLKSNYDFIENLKVDVFEDRIFVFTPHGDIIDLPEGANGIDFSYHIHTDVGDRAIGLLRNGRKCGLTTSLKTGDTVKVVLSPTQRLPRREWLKQAKTNLARNKIRASLRKQTKAACYQMGIEFLSRELVHYGGVPFKKMSKSQKLKLVREFEAKNWHQFLELVGDGSIPTYKVITTLYEPEELLGKPHGVGNESEAKSSAADPLGDYRVTMILVCRDRVGLLKDIGVQLANVDVNIYQIRIRPRVNQGQVDIDLVIELNGVSQLHRAFNALDSIEGIIDFYRISPNVPFNQMAFQDIEKTSVRPKKD